MTDRPHDALFKAAFERPHNAAGIFRSVLPPTLSTAIAWPTIQGEPASFIDEDLADHHSDLLFEADLHGKPALLYLLLEHQSTNDPDMPYRLFVYLARIWERFRKDPKTTTARLPPIIPAVISHAPDGWTAPKTLHAIVDPHPASIDGLAVLVPDFTYLVEDLSHLSNEQIWDHVVDAFAKVVLWLLRDTRDPETFLRNLDHLADLDALLDRILADPSGVAAIAQLLGYVSRVGNELQLDRFRAKIRGHSPHAEAAAMTNVIENAIQQGRAEAQAAMTNVIENAIQEGLEQGRAQGLAEARAAMLTKLLDRNFGPLPPELRTRIAQASPDALGRWFDRALTADTLDDVFDA